MAPLVSVIIPTYNRSEMLKRALESVRAQTFPDYEIVVIDDGSEDDTPPLRRLATQASRLPPASCWPFWTATTNGCRNTSPGPCRSCRNGRRSALCITPITAWTSPAGVSRFAGIARSLAAE